MQALLEKGLQDIHFIYVETGWSASIWPERVSACMAYARENHIQVHHLSAPMSFADMVMDRKQFPSRKFQWCAGFLKGLPILNFLDDYDPACEALIVSGKRQHDSRRYANLQEYEFQNELYQGRTLWHPLWQTDKEAFLDLINRTGFAPLPHPSLECSPCIHLDKMNLKGLDSFSKERLQALEEETASSMFQQPITQICSVSEGLEKDKNPFEFHLEQFDLGCGAPWGCGE